MLNSLSDQLVLEITKLNILRDMTFKFWHSDKMMLILTGYFNIFFVRQAGRWQYLTLQCIKLADRQIVLMIFYPSFPHFLKILKKFNLMQNTLSLFFRLVLHFCDHLSDIYSMFTWVSMYVSVLGSTANSASRIFSTGMSLLAPLVLSTSPSPFSLFLCLSSWTAETTNNPIIYITKNLKQLIS